MMSLGNKIQQSVAVLIAVYRNDRPEWFETAVISLTEQSHGLENIRIYLGVDGSIGEELEGCIQRRIHLFHKVIRNPRNEGLTRTLNRLIAALENESFVFRLDADDYCAPERFEKQIRFLQEHPEVEVLGSDIVEVDSSGRKIFHKEYPSGNEGIRRMMHRANPLAHSSVCFRRSFFDKIKGYPDDVTYNQDLALWFEGMKKRVKFANLPEPLVYMRVNGDFYRRRSRKRAFDEMKIYCRGIYALYGLSFRLCFPLARFLFRLLPVAVIRWCYASSLRNRLTTQVFR